jgi:transcriptional regulator with XRE-family HTH domain
MDALGRLLAEARRRKNLSLRAAEAATGISNAYLSQLESGKIQEPSPKILFKLAEHYGLRYEHMLELAGYPTQSAGDRTEASRLAARLGPTTTEEEEALAEYLEFLRSKARRRRAR